MCYMVVTDHFKHPFHLFSDLYVHVAHRYVACVCLYLSLAYEKASRLGLSTPKYNTPKYQVFKWGRGSIIPIVPSFRHSRLSLFPPFVAQFFFQKKFSKLKNSFKMVSPPFFTGGVSQKTCVILPKKNFIVPAFPRPKNFF
jgi:hypothetical protein